MLDAPTGAESCSRLKSSVGLTIFRSLLAGESTSGLEGVLLRSPALAGESATRWALVLGASSGFGEACSLALARAGWNLFGVPLDRKNTQTNLKQIRGERHDGGVRTDTC